MLDYPLELKWRGEKFVAILKGLTSAFGNHFTGVFCRQPILVDCPSTRTLPSQLGTEQSTKRQPVLVDTKFDDSISK